MTSWVRPLRERAAGPTSRVRDNATVTTLLLVHGGLWEPGMDADAFWRRPGVVAALEDRGFDVLAPDRAMWAPSWPAEADHLARAVPLRRLAAPRVGGLRREAAERQT